MHSQKKAFTLVELIVVITILAILGTIAFISLQGYAANARDSVRIQDIASIKKSLELYVTEKGKYPNPTDATDITYSGGVVWSQGTLGDSTVENLGKLNKKPVDPVLATEYSYSITNNKAEYELGGLLEGGGITNTPNIFNQTHAATGYRALVGGNYNGQVLKVTVSGIHYLLALPSITTTDTTTSTDLDTIVTNQSLVYNGEYNLPSNYNTVPGFTATGGFDYAPSNLVAFSGTNEELSLGGGKIKFIKNLQAAYSGSVLSTKTDFTELLSFDADTNSESALNLALNIFESVPQFSKTLQSTTFEPSFVGGLQLWLDATSDSSITKDGSNKVSQWNDRSGNGNHATQGTGNNQPVTNNTVQNGKNVIDFISNDFLSLPSNLFTIPNADNTIFVVSKQNVSNSNDRVINMQEVVLARYGVEYTSGGQIGYHNSWTSTMVATDITETNFNLITGLLSGTTQSVSVNGGVPTTNTSGNTGGSIVVAAIGSNAPGTAQFLDGSVGEILIYNKALSISEKNKVSAYLGKKWGIAIPAFNPNAISGLELWLDASDTSSITKDGSNKVSTWNDKSGNGNNVTQATGADQPTYISTEVNNKAGISFDGASDYLWSSGFGSFMNGEDKESTVFTVFKQDVTALGYLWMFGSLASETPIYGASLIETGFYRPVKRDGTGGIKIPVGTTPISPGSVYMATQKIDTGGITIDSFVNGSSDLSNEDINVGSTNLDQFSVGRSVQGLSRYVPYDGSISEVVIYNKALSDDEIEAIENYLKAKWDI